MRTRLWVMLRKELAVGAGAVVSAVGAAVGAGAGGGRGRGRARVEESDASDSDLEFRLHMTSRVVRQRARRATMRVRIDVCFPLRIAYIR